MSITDERIKAIFLAHGFKEKPQEGGSVDLNPYVYEAARALLAEAKIPTIPPGCTVQIQAPVLSGTDIIEAQRYVIEQATKSRIAAQEELQRRTADWLRRAGQLERDAYKRGRMLGRAEGFVKAQEMAADICDQRIHHFTYPATLAKGIRAMDPPDGWRRVWPEDQEEYGRLAAIGQNGNDGLHYREVPLSKPIPTADQVSLVDAAIQPPPNGAEKLILLSRYGVTTVGTYQHGFHVAWAPMTKKPASVKTRMGKQS